MKLYDDVKWLLNEYLENNPLLDEYYDFNVSYNRSGNVKISWNSGNAGLNDFLSKLLENNIIVTELGQNHIWVTRVKADLNIQEEVKASK